MGEGLADAEIARVDARLRVHLHLAKLSEPLLAREPAARRARELRQDARAEEERDYRKEREPEDGQHEADNLPAAVWGSTGRVGGWARRAGGARTVEKESARSAQLSGGDDGDGGKLGGGCGCGLGGGASGGRGLGGGEGGFGWPGGLGGGGCEGWGGGCDGDGDGGGDVVT